MLLKEQIILKLVSWNVNGLRAAVRKGFLDFFREIDADIFAVQEIKLQAGQIDLELDGYYQYWNYAERKGYSGTAIFSKQAALSVQYGLGLENEESEGRVITLEFVDYYVVTIYSPNSQRSLARLPIRMEWEQALSDHMHMLDAKKPVILCGDLNVAHQHIDIRNSKANEGNSGFTREERTAFQQLLDSGFTDTLRYFEPNTEGLYTWWSYMKTVRERNIGWRIDYFLVSNRIEHLLEKATTLPHIMGSDHCPILLEINDAPSS